MITYNREAFNIPNEQSYYWAGFIMADGYLTYAYNSTQLNIEISIKDIEHLYKFCKFIEISINHIHFRNKVCGIRLTSKTIIESLKHFGIYPNKTKHFIAPSNLNSKLLTHYLRGWFDGDGYITKYPHNKPLVDISGNYTSLKWYITQLQSLGFNSSFHFVHLPYTQNSSLRIKSKSGLKHYFYLLYYPANTYLERKWDNFKLYYN